MATSSYEHDADGCKYIPATQRPDGTWRKPRRVKDGYVPQEEVPLYESKGKLFKARQATGVPVGLTPEIVAAAKKTKKNTAQPIPGMIINNEKKKKKKKTGEHSAVDEVTKNLSRVEIKEPKFNNPVPNEPKSQADPAKRLKNLKKKIRDIEALEEKILSGILKTPNNDQKEKMSTKVDILKEIELLEGKTESS